MTRIPIKFSDIRDAFDFVSFGQPMEHEAYLCLKTGEIYWHSEYGDVEEPLPEDIDETGRYVEIPRKNDLGLGKALVLSFTEKHLPDSYDKVREIFSHSGAYARFKDLLDFHGMLKQWYEYEEKATEETLRCWCKDNDIEIIG